MLTPRMIDYLYNLTPCEEDHLLTEPFVRGGDLRYVPGGKVPGCLMQVARHRRNGWVNDDRFFVVGLQYDTLVGDHGQEAVNAAIRDQITENQAARVLAVVRATAGV